MIILNIDLIMSNRSKLYTNSITTNSNFEYIRNNINDIFEDYGGFGSDFKSIKISLEFEESEYKQIFENVFNFGYDLLKQHGCGLQDIEKIKNSKPQIYLMEIHHYKFNINYPNRSIDKKIDIQFAKHKDDDNNTDVETIIFYIENTFENNQGDLIVYDKSNNKIIIDSHPKSNNINYLVLSGNLLHEISNMYNTNDGHRISIVIQFPYEKI